MTLHIAIIGAGMAGVSAANVLTTHGCAATLFEKSRGYGGRCATKRWEVSTVDHGAQYFTIRDERFGTAVQADSGDALMKLLNNPCLHHGNYSNSRIMSSETVFAIGREPLVAGTIHLQKSLRARCFCFCLLPLFHGRFLYLIVYLRF